MSVFKHLALLSKIGSLQLHAIYDKSVGKMSKGGETPFKAVILAASRGRRMSSITSFLPKSMIPVEGKPLIVQTINFLEKTGIRDVCITLEPNLGPIIQRGIEHGYNGSCNIEFVYQQECNGIGFAILLCQKKIGENSFLVMFPDEFHPEAQNIQPNELSRQGSLLVLRSSQRIKDLLSKANVKVNMDGTVEKIEEIFDPVNLFSNYHLTGVLLLSPEVFRALHTMQSRTDLYIKGEFSICDSIQKMIDEGHKVEWIERGGFYANINSLDELERVHKFLSGSLEDECV